MDSVSGRRIVGVSSGGVSGSSAQLWSVQGRQSAIRHKRDTQVTTERQKTERSVHWPLLTLQEGTAKTENTVHLVQLQYQDRGGPAGVIEGQQEHAEHPGRAADQAGDDAPQALLLVTQHTVSGPV